MKLLFINITFNNIFNPDFINTNMETLKGFKDFTGEEAQKRAAIKKIIVQTFEKYGFEPAETPIIEPEEFVKSQSDENDEAISDTYKLEDKGKRKLALRYEFTFQLKRISNNKKLPYKRYQIGEVFRDEPASTNRFRQFTQCDADVIGSTIKDEAEILTLANEILDKLKIKSIIYINNRKLLNEILEKEGIKENVRPQVLRELDKYDKLPEKEIIENLKKFKAEKILQKIKEGQSYFKKFDSYKEILELMNYCKNFGVKVVFSPTVIRGLSYYNGTVFEIKSEKMKETMIAGGSYKVGENQCAGISFGVERVSVLAQAEINSTEYLVISLNQDKEAISIAQKLREKNKSVSIYYGKPSKALEYANAYSISKVIFVGEKEVKAKKFKEKDMTSGKEKDLKL